MKKPPHVGEWFIGDIPSPRVSTMAANLILIGINTDHCSGMEPSQPIPANEIRND